MIRPRPLPIILCAPTRVAALAALAALAACGGDGPAEPAPDARVPGVITSVAVTLADSVVQIGQLTQATATARDAFGTAIALGARRVTWSSGNPSVVVVGAGGVVSAVGVGSADLAVRVAEGATEVTGTARLRVTGIPNAPALVDVVMPGLTFSPAQVVVRQGGTVRFVFPALAHNVIWDPRLAGSPQDIGVLSNTVVPRTFLAVGVFKYTCTLHPGMDGEVIVTP
jgi:plastocyanin/predicted small lipoprotein YifL